MKLPVSLIAASFIASAQAQDECVTAFPVIAGGFTFDSASATLSSEVWGCAGNGGPDFWYVFTAVSTGPVTIATCGSTYDTAIQVFTGSCGSLTSIACNDDACNTIQSSLTFPATAGVAYTFRLGGYNGATGFGICTIDDGSPVLNPANGNYYVAVNQNGITWDQALLDAAATSYQGVSGHLATVASGDEQSFLTVALGGVQWHWLGGFQNTQSPTYSEPGGGWEWITGEPFTYTQWFPGEPNNSGTLGAEDYLEILNGDWNDAGQMEHPRGYVIEYEFMQGLGTPYCMANANSSGVPAAMSGGGSATVALNDVTITCADMPAFSFGFFLTSETQGFIMNPGGSHGNLCLGGAIGRYVGPGQIQNSGSAGEISAALDLTLTPTPTGFISIQPGDTRSYQCWFRDAVGGVAVSNFSNGLEVMFL